MGNTKSWPVSVVNYYEIYITQPNSSEYSAYLQDGKWVIKDAENALTVLLREIDELRKVNKELLEINMGMIDVIGKATKADGISGEELLSALNKIANGE